MITANPKTMIKFKLHLGTHTGRSRYIFFRSNDFGRKYRDISVHARSVVSGVSIIEQCGEDLRHLKFCDLKVTKIGAFVESFAHLQKLEKLEFVTSVVMKECLELRTVDGANLPKLRTVVFDRSNWTVKFVIFFNV